MANADIEDIMAEFEKLAAEIYRRGVSAGIDTVFKSAIRNTKMPHGQSYQPSLFQPEKLAKESQGYRSGTVIEKVHKIIQETPGLTGTQIVEKLQGKDSLVEERTVRTSLSRLKARGLTKNVNGEWHAI